MNDLREVSLTWQGPISSPTELPASPGLYAISGQMYGSAGVRLLYVGEAKSDLSYRWKDSLHREWLTRSARFLNAKLHYTVVDSLDSAMISEIETVLIYVHQPHQNSSKIMTSLPSSRYLIHNLGDLPDGLLPVIDTNYPWFGLRPEG